MAEFAFRVSQLRSRHHVRTVSAAVSDVAGVREVVVDLERRVVTVRGTPEPDAIRAALAAVGFGLVAEIVEGQ